MVYTGLSGVVKQVFEITADSAHTAHDSLVCANPDNLPFISDAPLQVALDTLMNNEFGCLKENKDFVYGIMDTVSGELICGNYTTDNAPLLKNTHHRLSFSRITHSSKHQLLVFFPEEKHLIIRRMLFWLIILSGFFLLIVVNSFLFIIFHLLKQKKISEMKNDFINNMTHEFKTPISTISVASEMLLKPTVYDNPEKTRKYANIIYDENLRLRNQVEQVLQISILDRNELKINKSEIDVHKILENTVEIFNLIIRERDGRVSAELNATKPVIMADELHFINVITNMVDNAIKYSVGKSTIHLITLNNEHGLLIRVQDSGIGISAADQKHIYKKFFRVHTGDVHDVKGFGLGLFYVKSVVDAHSGSVRLLKSELNSGSVFELFFPFK